MQFIGSGKPRHKKRPHVHLFAVYIGKDKSAQKKEEIDSQETPVEYGNAGHERGKMKSNDRESGETSKRRQGNNHRTG
jgi:hypothetical protein